MVYIKKLLKKKKEMANPRLNPGLQTHGKSTVEFLPHNYTRRNFRWVKNFSVKNGLF